MARPYSKDKDNCPKHSFDGDGYCISCDMHFDIRIAQLEEDVRQQWVNAAFFRSCALSGELPTHGCEPYPATDGKVRL